MLRLALVACSFIAARAANYAVLVSGSSGWGNYRHHADVCHAYKILSDNGIPDSNIITMLYDDVADSRNNPFPGELYNKPGKDAVEVYKNCKKDYTGQSVTAEMFLAVLTGDASKTNGGPVLTS